MGTLQVYEGVMTWIRNSPEERAEHLPDLLAAVRLPLISSKYLVDHIEKVGVGSHFFIYILIYVRLFVVKIYVVWVFLRF